MDSAAKTIKKLKKSSTIEMVERKSVFIGFSTNVENEQEAIEIIKEKKSKYYDATHNVYAYVLDGGNIARYSDDGEPQGTAGIPVLNAIKMSDVTDSLVIVTRYFGGILLGAGGLVRAYSACASKAIETSGIAIWEKYIEYECELSYSDYQRLLSVSESYDMKTDKSLFSENVFLKFAIPEKMSEIFLTNMNELLSGRVSFKMTGDRFDSK